MVRGSFFAALAALGCSGPYVAGDGSGGADGLGGASPASGGLSSTGGATETGGSVEPGTGGVNASGGQVASGGSPTATGGSDSGGSSGTGGAAAGGTSTGGAASDPVVLWTEGYEGSVSPDLDSDWVSASISWDDDNCPSHVAAPIFPGDTLALEIALGADERACIGDSGSIPVMHFGPQDWILEDGPHVTNSDDPSLRARFVLDAFACQTSPTKSCTATFRWELLRD